MSRQRLSTRCMAISLLLFSACSSSKPTEQAAPVPSVTTSAVTGITQSTAESGGNVTSDGGTTVTARGVCWSTSTTPKVTDNKTTDGAGAGSFTSSITGLAGNTPYFVRAYAINSAGTGYGMAMAFTSSSIPPIVLTDSVRAITPTSAQCGGTISSDGGAAVTARGVCWSTSTTPTVADNKTADGTGGGSFASAIIGLSGSTPYYVRAYATNGAGTAYGSVVSFNTPPAVPPTLITDSVRAFTPTTAQCGGTITSDGGATVTSRGVCWSQNTTPMVVDNKTTDGTGTGSFTSSITGLTQNTSYYVRAYATNSAGTGYGMAMAFVTAQCVTGTVTDTDGNVYETVKIGTQWWMAENLKVSHFRNGDVIPYVTDSVAWAGLPTAACCVYQNNFGNVTEYGRLYNGHAVLDVRNLAPVGWHVPADSEWQALVDYLGGSAVAGGKIKEAGLTHWHTPNTGATNESCFSALPGGFRDDTGYHYMSAYGGFWTSTENGPSGEWGWSLNYDSREIRRGDGDKKGGFSIRCVKD
jgi:uncharacterized protein (TIGR02145 family)